MRKYPAILFITLAIFLGSCIVENYTREHKSDCPVHHLKLKIVWGRLNYSPPGWLPASCPYSLDAKPSLGCEPPKIQPLVRRARIYVCDSCTVVCRQLRS